MRTIQDIYAAYRIPPNLQLHMYRVAALGLYISDHLFGEVSIDRDVITQVNLLHDLGNLVKFDFGQTVSMGMNTDDVPYWKKVQEELIVKYGKDEDVVTDALIRELGVKQRVFEILTQHRLDKIQYAIDTDDWDAKIVRLSDTRISPDGVVTIAQRWMDIRKRYANKDHHLADSRQTQIREEKELILEKQIQSKATINLQTITNTDIEPYIEPLKNFEI